LVVWVGETLVDCAGRGRVWMVSWWASASAQRLREAETSGRGAVCVCMLDRRVRDVSCEECFQGG